MSRSSDSLGNRERNQEMSRRGAETQEITAIKENEISGFFSDLFIRIHSQLGPGLLESVYEEIICHELAENKIPFRRQQGIPVVYNDVKLNLGFRADIIVDNKVIIEITSIEQLAPVHHKQLLTYLKLTDQKLGILINFNVDLIKNGYHRIVNKLQRSVQVINLCAFA
ncbi:MAG: GxxExxY protein [Bacteroidia bacterium]